MSLIHFLKIYFIVNLLEIGFGGNTYLHARNNSSNMNDSVPLIKIGLIADPQYCDCEPAGNRYYRETLKRLPEAVDTFNKSKVDFVMNLGDMIDKYENSYDSVIRFYDKLKMPFYNQLGNHEFEQVSDNFKSSVLERYKMPDYYYDFSFKNWRIIILDGTELGKYSRNIHPDLAKEADSLWQSAQGKLNELSWNGGISRRQQQWLQNRLKDALKTGQNVIIFCHFPVYPDSIDLTLWNSSQIIDILESYPNVVAYISGHYHEGSYGYKKGINYLTLNAMVDTPDKNSYAIMEIYTNEIRIKGFGDIIDRVLPFPFINNY